MTTVNAMQLRVQDYLDERRRLGHALGIAGSRLLAFARFADDVGHKGPLTLQLIVDWAQGQATRATPITWARRLEIIRPFAKFCAQDDTGTAIPSADLSVADIVASHPTSTLMMRLPNSCWRQEDCRQQAACDR